ncbi:unnamed protein product (mitochondrion) [Plasmodiophora brassicae]|uniref:Uncharacterized protein n=1 Tax=Plasmodiophora brassicae TaxID=37360 RepID=A0A0G4IRY0_PLABS|nr:hypothetical protein PBRA_005980 [Plasmodiophora brassicae]SPQ98085.1 unnamed protein product [Plasmodiophora brassicae]
MTTTTTTTALVDSTAASVDSSSAASVPDGKFGADGGDVVRTPAGTDDKVAGVPGEGLARSDAEEGSGGLIEPKPDDKDPGNVEKAGDEGEPAASAAVTDVGARSADKADDVEDEPSTSADAVSATDSVACQRAAVHPYRAKTLMHTLLVQAQAMSRSAAQKAMDNPKLSILVMVAFCLSWPLLLLAAIIVAVVLLTAAFWLSVATAVLMTIAMAFVFSLTCFLLFLLCLAAITKSAQRAYRYWTHGATPPASASSASS